MENNILFSVVIPTFNRVDFIEKTIASVIHQKFQQFEIIVVDDGSTDHTRKVMESQTDRRIKYFNTENNERAAARNFGGRQASGKYITFLDSDDVLKDNHLSVAADFVMKNSASEFFHLGYDVVRPDGSVITPWRRLPDPANEKLIEGNFLSCLGVFIKREIFLNNFFNEDRALSGSEDYELWIRMASRYPIRTVATSTACLVNHEERSVQFIEPEKLNKRIALTKFYMQQDEMVVNRFGAKLKVIFAYLDLYEALHLVINNHKKLSGQALQSARKDFPGIIWNYRFWVVVKKLIVR